MKQRNKTYLKIFPALSLIILGVVLGFWGRNIILNLQERFSSDRKLFSVIFGKQVINLENKPVGNSSTSTIEEFALSQFNLISERGGIELSQIKALCDLPDEDKLRIGLSRFQIVDGKLYGEFLSGGDRLRFNLVTEALLRLLEQHKISNIDFVLFLSDETSPVTEGGKSIVANSPAFVMSKNRASSVEKNLLLLPDEYLMRKKMWPNLIKNIKLAELLYRFEDKEEKIFWRGSSTGGTYNLNNYATLPRLSLVMMSKSFPHLIDAKFTNYVQFSDDKSGQDLRNVLEILFGQEHKWVKERDHLKYKYLISVDGNTAAWLRVPWIMLSNSVLLKQESDYIEIFSSSMKPFVHYVPIKHDLSDIMEKLEWLKNNDEQAKKIAYNATKFVEENLMPEHIHKYVAIIFNRYHELQNFQIEKATLPQIIK